MKITRTTHFKAIISDKLFFYLLQAGLPQAETCDVVIDEMPIERIDQEEVVGAIDDPYSVDDWWELIDQIDQTEPLISSFEIRPTTEDYNWGYPVIYDTCTWEEFYNEQD